MTPRIELEQAQPGTASRFWGYLGGWRGLALRVGIVALAALAASQHVLRGDSLLVLLALAAPGALLARRGAMPLAIYTVAWLAFSLLRAGMNDLGMPDQGATFAALDRFLAGGVTPTERLQAAFYTPGSIGVLDAIATGVYTSYYAAPHLAAVGLWLYGSRTGKLAAFRSYLFGSIAMLAVGLALYGLLPTSPPWIEATVEDDMRVYRITRAANAGETRDPEQVYTFFTDPNPVAAMPSLHTAITVVMAFALWRARRWLGIAGGVYSLAMGFSLVYLGEHYVVDVLAGAGLAAAIMFGVSRLPAGPWGRRSVHQRLRDRSDEQLPGVGGGSGELVGVVGGAGVEADGAVPQAGGEVFDEVDDVLAVGDLGEGHVAGRFDLALVGGWLAGERFEQPEDVVVGVEAIGAGADADDADWAGLDAGLFHDFAGDGGVERLAGIDEAAGDHPAAEARAVGHPDDEQALALDDERADGGDVARGAGFGSREPGIGIWDEGMVRCHRKSFHSSRSGVGVSAPSTLSPWSRSVWSVLAR